jgi:RecA-family ATPase
VLEQAQSFGARLVVLDSLHDLFAGNENSRPQARHFINTLRRIAIAINGGVLLTAHPSLSGRNTGTGEAGSTAWHNAVRSRLYLTAAAQQDGEDIDPNRRVLTNKKANYGPSGEAIECEWRNGVFVPSGQGFSKSSGQNQADEIFLECLDLLTERGTLLSEATNSPFYAPKAMKRLEATKKISMRDLAKAMERLFSAGKIRNEATWDKGRNQRRVIVRVNGGEP